MSAFEEIAESSLMPSMACWINSNSTDAQGNPTAVRCDYDGNTGTLAFAGQNAACPTTGPKGSGSCTRRKKRSPAQKLIQQRQWKPKALKEITKK